MFNLKNKMLVNESLQNVQFLFESGEYGKAIKICNAIIKQEPMDYRGHSAISRCYLRRIPLFIDVTSIKRRQRKKYFRFLKESIKNSIIRIDILLTSKSQIDQDLALIAYTMEDLNAALWQVARLISFIKEEKFKDAIKVDENLYQRLKTFYKTGDEKYDTEFNNLTSFRNETKYLFKFYT